jgi:hypothetical protein
VGQIRYPTLSISGSSICHVRFSEAWLKPLHFATLLMLVALPKAHACARGFFSL